MALIQWATDRGNGTRALAAQIGHSIMGAPVPESIARTSTDRATAPTPTG
ncbi:hypothetical protein AB1285_27470 [Microbacterium sp. NRRL B-14842]